MFSIVKEVLFLLSRRGKLRILLATILQIFITLFDVLGIGLIAASAILAVKLFGTDSNESNSNQIYVIVNSITHDDLKSVYLMLSLSMVFFVFKTIISSVLFRNQLNYLATRDLEISGLAIRAYFRKKFVEEGNLSIQEKVSALTHGVWLVSSEIIGNFIVIISELILLVLISILLGFTNIMLTIITICYFSLVFFVLHILLGTKLQIESTKSTRAGLDQQNVFRSILSARQEILIFGRQDYFSKLFLFERSAYSNSSARVLFLLFMPKMFLEISLILGIFLLFVNQLLSSGAVAAVTTLAIYLAAGTRVLPSLLRLQNASSGLKAAIPGARVFLDYLPTENLVQSDLPLFKPQNKVNGAGVGVVFREIAFAYANSSQFSLQDIKLEIDSGSACAIVGDSASGKSTLINILMDFIKPNSGTVSFKSPDGGSLNFGDFEVGLVPQSVSIISGTIEENILLGRVVPEESLLNALLESGLIDWLRTLPDGLKTNIIEDGLNLSGGQIQRIGIARALISKPCLIVLDEATGALDEESHRNIHRSLRRISYRPTIVSISHNWSVLEEYDKIISLDQGRIAFQGNFSEFENHFGK